MFVWRMHRIVLSGVRDIEAERIQQLFMHRIWQGAGLCADDCGDHSSVCKYPGVGVAGADWFCAPDSRFSSAQIVQGLEVTEWL